jgi:hypothetical protein
MTFSRIDPPIAEHLLSLNIFKYFPHSLTKLSDFSIMGRAIWRPTNVLSASEVKEQCRKHRERMSDNLLQNLWEK